MTKTEIKKLWSLYTSGLAVDTPVEIGLALEDIYDGVVSVEDGQGSYHINDPHREPTQPTVYYKVVRKCVHKVCGSEALMQTGGDELQFTVWTCPKCEEEFPPTGLNYCVWAEESDPDFDSDWTLTEYIYFYLYFPVDTKAPHKHDWTGGMIEVVDGVAKRMVCRSHWDMVVERSYGHKMAKVDISSGDHSLFGSWLYGPIGETKEWKRLDYNLILLTDELSDKIRQIAKTASITHHETWGDRKAMVWCRYRHPFQYKALCKRYGAYSPAPWYDFWSSQFPDPSAVYDKYPALFWAIMERIGK